MDDNAGEGRSLVVDEDQVEDNDEDVEREKKDVDLLKLLGNASDNASEPTIDAKALTENDIEKLLER